MSKEILIGLFFGLVIGLILGANLLFTETEIEYRYIEKNCEAYNYEDYVLWHILNDTSREQVLLRIEYDERCSIENIYNFDLENNTFYLEYYR